MQGGDPSPLPHRTFRDPAGSLQIQPDCVLRSVKPAAAHDLLAFLATPLASDLVSRGRLIPSEIVDSGPDGVELRHPRVSFISYPWEWPDALLVDAGELTLELCIELVGSGWSLKDATPLNVLFEGARPVFVDILSVERLNPASSLWLPYAQFVRTFLLPLVAHTQLGWPLSATQLRRDGFEPEELYRALNWPRRLRRPVLGAVTLPMLLSRMSGSVAPGQTGLESGEKLSRRITSPDINRDVLLRHLRKLRSALHRAAPQKRSSTWSDYAETAGHYSEAEHVAKRAFVGQALDRVKPETVLDVGSNTGTYSRLAAEAGARVVAIDSDVEALNRIHRQGAASHPSILPLCVDLSFPTPALGWRNRETLSFLDRAEGSFDAVLMLAVIHHLLVSSQIPLDEIAALAARLTRAHLVIEWVPLQDPKFVEILRGRDAIYNHLTEDAFRSAFGAHFTVASEQSLPNGRILFHMVKH